MILTALFFPGFAPMLLGLSAPVDAAALQQQSLTTHIVKAATAGANELNNHPYIFHDGSQFWAMWSFSVSRHEDQSGQRVAYATSVDGETWSAHSFVTPIPPLNYRYIARGFWERNGELLAIVAIDESNEGYFGDGLELRAFKWSGAGFDDAYLVQDNSISNFPPVPYPGGGWIYARRTHDEQISLSVGDIGSWTDYSVPAPTDGAEFNEPTIFFNPDGNLTALVRDNNGSKIYRGIYSSLSDPLGAVTRTNFPDASSKHFALTLQDGRTVLISNPGKTREVLAMSTSEDGYIFDRMVKLQSGAPAIQWPGGGKLLGYQYPHAVEVGGYLYVICVESKEDVIVSKIDIDDID